ncbi:hypothetical protein K440DRAFT_125852 [Wilcoxina mikolae CBS 423.85]|nr:hypothetical protein K440DRAFT_125852 [Wilcoxina mikolae CBS 423.85]
MRLSRTCSPLAGDDRAGLAFGWLEMIELAPGRSCPASREPAQFDHLQPPESESRASPAQSSPASREPAQLDHLQPAAARSRPAIREPALARSCLAIESQPSSIISS